MSVRECLCPNFWRVTFFWSDTTILRNLCDGETAQRVPLLTNWIWGTALPPSQTSFPQCRQVNCFPFSMSTSHNITSHPSGSSNEASLFPLAEPSHPQHRQRAVRTDHPPTEADRTSLRHVCVLLLLSTQRGSKRQVPGLRVGVRRDGEPRGMLPFGCGEQRDAVAFLR